HKIELETQFSYTYLDGEDTNTSNLSVGGVAVHTYGPWKNTLSVDLDYENSDENGKEKSHLISLETRRKILQDKYTMFALVKSLKNTDESESKSMIVGIGRDFHDLFGTGIDGEINLGAGPTRISDSLGQTTKDNVIYSGVKGSRKIGGIVINGEFTDETGLEESTRSSTFKLTAQYCLDTGCNIKIGPAYKRNAVKSGSGEQSRDITYTLELSAKFK
ncbi:MAG: DUF481 domain-containing protein, partial [Bdellovibrionales bacterium]|nr:DUF481 domain-containing protein [Bdellovibrionales bacterium]